jgi:hypothetical protein
LYQTQEGANDNQRNRNITEQVQVKRLSQPSLLTNIGKASACHAEKRRTIKEKKEVADMAVLASERKWKAHKLELTKSVC